MGQNRSKDWRELCMAAATELDPAKLMELIGEINRALDERDQKRKASLANVNGNNCVSRSLQHAL